MIRSAEFYEGKARDLMDKADSVVGGEFGAYLNAQAQVYATLSLASATEATRRMMEHSRS
jgi:hypothetical protein